LKFFYTIFFCCITAIGLSQNFKIEGKIFDGKSQKIIPEVNIVVNGTKNGTISDETGHYTLKKLHGNLQIVVNHIGYEQIIQDLYLQKDTIINFYLKESIVEIDEVAVKGIREDENVTKVETGIVELSTKEMESLPKFLGEADLIKTIKLTPGIQTTSEISSGLHVRGGGAGQNLIVLDDLPLYNPSHLLGIFSVFNSDVIDKVTLIKGGMPANYGGRASSTLEISLKEGTKDKPRVSGSIGLISTKLTAELPVNNGKGSLIIGARRTFLGLFQAAAKPVLKKSNKFINDTRYFFYDFNSKFTYKLTDKDLVIFNVFLGKDYYELDRGDIDFTNKMEWGNRAVSFRWNHIFNSNFSVDNVVGYTDYKFDLGSTFEDVRFNLYTQIEDVFYKLNFNYLAWDKHKIKYGIQYTKHKLVPNEIRASATDFIYGKHSEYFSHEVSAYYNDIFNLTDRLSLLFGLRANMFYHVGPYDDFSFDPTDFSTDTTSYKKNELVSEYFNPELRLSFNYRLSEFSSIKGSISSNTQQIHLASIGSVSLPTDIWLPSTSFIKPERVNQVTLGYFRNFEDNTYETSIEGYYKLMDNQLKFKTGFLSSFDNATLEENLAFGNGQSYGVELFIKKRKGLNTGWISYTLSKTTLEFPELANGEPFFAKYDQRHDLALVYSRELTEKWSLSTVFVYTTGNALTLPVGRYMVQGNLLNHYTDINSFRMPAYHRLDVSFNYKPQKNRKYQTSWDFGIYNVYNRSNPYYIFFKIEGDIDEYYLKVEAKQVSLFPIMPFVAWSFKF
jgi:CarboxypepD_reg-like domain/TonB-dependent Receptor Plug Domain